MMSFGHLSKHLLAALGFSLSIAGGAHAAYSNLYIFGDSLSDTGNVYTASGHTDPNPLLPYYQGRFSNGPVWVETLASGLGHSSASTAWLNGGNNYAWAGATSGLDGLAGAGTGLLSQVIGQWGSNPANANPADNASALFVLSVGGNDLRYVDIYNNPTPTPLSNPTTIFGNLISSIDYLISKGAKNFLIANAPDLGLTPEAAAHKAEASALAQEYNALLATGLSAITVSQSVNIAEFDLFGLLNDVVDDTQAGGAKYGFTDASSPCFLSGLSCDTSVFSDPLHPTAKVHSLAGNAALALLKVPEPDSSMLMAIALMMILLSRRYLQVAKTLLSPLSTGSI